MTAWAFGRGDWLTIAVVVLVVAGCGAEKSVPSTAPAQKRARTLLINVERLPEKYKVANGQDYPGELKACGVRLEPQSVRGFAIMRYTRTVVGPFLYELVFVGSETANRRLVDRVEQQLKTCSKDVVNTDDGRIVYAVRTLRGLPRYAQDSVGLRLDPRRDGLTSEYLLIQRDEVLVLLFTAAPEGMQPPRKLLTAGAAAVVRQLDGGGN